METIKIKVVIGVNDGDTCFSACGTIATFSDLRNRVWEKLGTASKLYQAVLEVPKPMPPTSCYVASFCLHQ